MFRLSIFLTALLPKPRRSHRYPCVCEAALSEKYSAPNITVFRAAYTSRIQYKIRNFMVKRYEMIVAALLPVVIQ